MPTALYPLAAAAADQLPQLHPTSKSVFPPARGKRILGIG